MVAMLQGIGVASASATPLDHYNKLGVSSVQSLPVIRSEGRSNLGSIFGVCRARKLITKAVAAKADSNATSDSSKTGYELLLFEALREGLEEEMARDPRVCVMGEDVGHYGGSYKVTKDLANKFGDLRVLDTPIAENSFTGMAVEQP
ncbi:unnamed protein product [Ilex paraguariensis]|uniref:pyruvate dehydrogenase (acetyl-transferring) n=1 Tax=Ilex paraguariensis TaxID=185542 RepID=A0ABC8SSU6_9AQUA